MHGDGESQADIHAGGVGLDRLINELADSGELHDAIEARINLAPAETEHDAVDVDVLAAGDLRMEPRTELNERSDSSAHPYDAAARLENAGDDFQQRRFAGAVPSNDSKCLAALDDEGDITERGDARLGRELEIALEERTLERRELGTPSPQAVVLRHTFQGDDGTQMASASVSRSRSKTAIPRVMDASAYAIISSASDLEGKRPKKSTS